jgi:hypothetical protein
MKMADDKRTLDDQRLATAVQRAERRNPGEGENKGPRWGQTLDAKRFEEASRPKGGRE